MVTILLVSVFFIVLNFCLVDCMNVTLLLLLDIVLWTAMQLFINYRIKVYQSVLKQNEAFNPKNY